MKDVLSTNRFKTNTAFCRNFIDTANNYQAEESETWSKYKEWNPSKRHTMQKSKIRDTEIMADTLLL